jgi:hypothetical protein
MFALKAATCRRAPSPSRTWDDAVPEAAHFWKSPATTEKILIAEYQRLITLFAPLARLLQYEREESFESSKYTNCFSL